MRYQVAILTHEKGMQQNALPQTKIMNIIRPIALREDAINVAFALKPHIHPMDMLIVYDDSTDNKQVIFKYDQGKLWQEGDVKK